MSDFSLGIQAEDLLIRPSPGERGSIKCGICGNPDLKLFFRESEQKVTGVVIFCSICHNSLEFTYGNDSSR